MADALRKEIVLGVLAPGEPVLELALARRFGCSQSTVREALLRLEQDGLVDRQAHRGTRVAPCCEADAHMLLEVRHTIECRAIARSVPRAAAALPALHDALDAMRVAAKAGDEYALSVHDRRFHLGLFEAADLPAVRPILGRCLIHNHRYKILNSQPNRSLGETAERHVAILDAVAAGDADAARRALSHHIATIVDLGPSILGTKPFGEEAP
ncbi:MAG: GntR family transcriptional regulator [Pseudomonadota bacterium]